MMVIFNPFMLKRSLKIAILISHIFHNNFGIKYGFTNNILRRVVGSFSINISFSYYTFV